MVAKQESKPTSSGEQLVFRGSDGLWITLTVLAVLVGVLVLWAFVSAPSLATLLVGGVFAALLAAGAWFSARQRREVVLDREGLLVRTSTGQERLRLAWSTVTRVESRQLPSMPFQPAVVFHCVDDTSLLLDPQQVRETGRLVREAERLRQNAARRPTSREEA